MSKRVIRSTKAGVPIVRAVERAIALLRAFSSERPRQTLTELALSTSLDKNTTRRLLHTLEAGGLVEHSEGHYALSFGLHELLSAVTVGGDLRDIALPTMHRVAAETSATTFLWVYQDGFAVCVERVRPPQPTVEVTWSPIGSRNTLNSGGGPLTILGYLPPEKLAVALEHPLISRTPFSITNPGELQRRAAKIAKDGYVIAENDFVVGLSGVGVPILHPNGDLIAALSISSLCDHVKSIVEADGVKKLKMYAHAIARRL
ncbi:IclR family transcriptional regulator [Mesorhizobium sp. STM 4661]|uniref:IclR family transcriptional regulator n=1 Tax=Mesorhizobium sp. STM 4661 TaxID=1297570 RepID=UPI001FCBF480|nr:IclR family transcriptional regulator [Mesorhizobium sp. STM 4661]